VIRFRPLEPRFHKKLVSKMANFSYLKFSGKEMATARSRICLKQKVKKNK